ncbi:MAG: DNA polymerase III subunit delta [Pseudomonadota bacterium]
MQLRGTELDDHLAGQLAPLYFVSGDETLLVEEACDLILAAARQRGFNERTILSAETGFRWSDLAAETSALSLFASQRIFDVRLSSNKVDREASEVLRAYADEPAADTLLLIRCPRLDGKQKSTAWFKALDRAGVVMQLWPVPPNEMPRWLQQRLRRAGLKLDRDASLHLAQATEGNLLAAQQEIDKLQLLDLPQPIALEALLAATADAATYSPFDLMDSVLLGDAARSCRMLRVLREEGASLFALQGALRAQLSRADGSGPVYGPRDKQRAVAAFRRRIVADPHLVADALAQLALIDAQAKGAFAGDPWVSFERLLLLLAGAPIGTIEDDARVLLR